MIGVILVGQPELLRTLDNSTIREVNQRCSRLTLYGLRGKTADYLRFKLQRAGASTEIFTKDAIDAIELRFSKPVLGTRKFTGPFPLQVNVCATACLNWSERNGLNQVTAEVVDKAWGSSGGAS